MAKPRGGLTEWFGKGPKGDWVDIGAPKKKGKFQSCGRSKLAKDKKRKYPKCVPRATANRMTKSQITSAVKRKRAKAQGVGGKPTNVRTFVKKKKSKKTMNITPELINTAHSISWFDGILYIILGLGTYAAYRWIKKKW